jgi:hypothetical protein
MNHLVRWAKGYIKAKIYAWKRYQNIHPSDRGYSQINLLKGYPIFRPNMGGDYPVKAEITSESIRNTFPFLLRLSQSVGHTKLKTIDCPDFPEDPEANAAALRLQQLFDLRWQRQIHLAQLPLALWGNLETSPVGSGNS